MTSGSGTRLVWDFFSSHAHVLLAIHEAPGRTTKELSERVGITERQIHRLMSELEASGYLTRTRVGRRTHYHLIETRPVPDETAKNVCLGGVLRLFAPSSASL